MAANRAMEVIANNLANLSTPAFKRESIRFEQYVVPVPATEAEIEQGDTVNVSFVFDRGVARDLSEGRFEQTDRCSTCRSRGPAISSCRHLRASATRATAISNWTIRDGLSPMTAIRFRAMGGAITLQPQEGDLRLGTDGTLSTDLQILGKLRVVNVRR
jgi:flagellar basal-body rod protein FlgF